MKSIKDDYLEDNLITLLSANVIENTTDAKKNVSPSVDEDSDEEPDEPEETHDISRFEAIAQEADKVNKNNRIYPKDVLLSALDKLQSKLKRKEVFAMSDHPSMFDGPRLGRIAAIIHEAALNDKGKVIIKGEFLNNDAAKEVKSLLKMGVKVGVSARGWGDYDIDPKKGTMIFKEGYEIEGWDFVVYPAANAKITHFESENKVDISKEDTKMEIRTIDGLRAAYPELVASVEKPHLDKISELTTSNKTTVAELTAKLTAAETATTELQKKNDEISKRLDETCKALDEAAGRLKIAIDENTKMKADIAAAELKVAIDNLLKDNKYAQFIKLDASLDTIDKVKAYVDAETAKFEAFAATLKPAEKVESTKSKNEDSVIPDQPKAKAEDTESKIDNKVDPVMDSYIALATKNSNKIF